MKRIHLVKPNAFVKCIQIRHETVHDQLNAFVGITFNHDDRFWIIWGCSVRCQLADVLFNEEFNMTKDFSDSFIRDILKVPLRRLLHTQFRGCNSSTKLVNLHTAR